jgi:hypothetical protein
MPIKDVSLKPNIQIQKTGLRLSSIQRSLPASDLER